MKRIAIVLRRMLGGAALVASVGAAWAGGVALRHSGLFAGESASDEAEGYVPSNEIKSGKELMLVFIVGAFCAASTDPELPATVEQVKVRAAAAAEAAGYTFRVVGVSIDWRQKEGLELLNRYGRFDQIAVGGNWLNDSAVKYLWRDIPGQPQVPQVIFLERHVDVRSETIEVGAERLVARLAGREAIHGWLEADRPLPLSGALSAE